MRNTEYEERTIDTFQHPDGFLVSLELIDSGCIHFRDVFHDNLSEAGSECCSKAKKGKKTMPNEARIVADETYTRSERQRMIVFVLKFDGADCEHADQVEVVDPRPHEKSFSVRRCAIRDKLDNIT
jgi:hypothetical protein